MPSHPEISPGGSAGGPPTRSRRVETRLINPTRGFKTLPTASATIKGFEVMRMIRKGQCLMLEQGPTGDVRFVNRLFHLAAPDESRRAGQSARRGCYCNRARASSSS
jgi:hypothetical protein